MFSGFTLPFTAADLLDSGVQLLGVVGLFVLMGLAFAVAPKLVTLIVRAFATGSLSNARIQLKNEKLDREGYRNSRGRWNDSD